MHMNETLCDGRGKSTGQCPTHLFVIDWLEMSHKAIQFLYCQTLYYAQKSPAVYMATAELPEHDDTAHYGSLATVLLPDTVYFSNPGDSFTGVLQFFCHWCPRPFFATLVHDAAAFKCFWLCCKTCDSDMHLNCNSLRFSFHLELHFECCFHNNPRLYNMTFTLHF
jgi:hypothetical protein